jgi:LAGLIDADG DNA endonuclease family
MDDGGKSVYNESILHTRAFNKEEVLLLQNALKVCFNLTYRMEEKTKNQWIIYIQVRQKIPLKEIIKPYMHESMLYKI